MERILNYKITQEIEDSKSAVVYRARKDEENQAVVIKVLKAEYPSASEIARFKRDHRILSTIELEGVVNTFHFDNYKDGFALVLEDFKGVSLKTIMEFHRIDLKTFLSIAIQLADTLGHLQKLNIIHKNLKPDSILFSSKDCKAKITDFGTIADLTRENKEIFDPQVIRESLAYISPEQTGRMNRTVDHRSDLYSLGTVFYEMLTGTIPFASDDPLDMIYSHIAREPRPPWELAREIPQPISHIVMKLLSKAAEERYQSGFGLMADLEECLDQLKNKGRIDPFEIARKDMPIRFRLPEKIIGRQTEIDALLDSYDKVRRGNNQMILVSGPPGIGKSALIQDILRPTVTTNGCFISGKFEQLRQDLPYSAVIHAYQRLVRQVLAESRERIAVWKKELLKALGPNGRVITEVIPEVELIIGKQPVLVELTPEESQNRFGRIFRSFTRVFARRQHPLVIFLDDLQWADSASLHLMGNLITDRETKFLFLIGAYRDNEVPWAHPLNRSVKDIENEGVNVDHIHLCSLSVADFKSIIGNILRDKGGRSLVLSELMHKKTGGNPFFLRQFMEMLYQDGLLWQDATTGWQWDIDKIEQLQVTDNVVDLMVEKIVGLPHNARMMLEVCSCIGDRFDLETLSGVLGESMESTLSDLTDVISQGLINMLDDIYMFHHDRILEAVYSLIPENKRAELHYRIGKFVIAATDEIEVKANIYYVVNQLNLGVTLVEERNERVHLARLNLMAGLKAKKSTAYESADKFLKQARQLLPADAWDSEYELALSLHLESGEVGYLIGDQEVGEKFLFEVLQKARCSLDKVRVHETKIPIYTTYHRYEEAFQLGREALKILGQTLPRRATQLHVIKEFLKTKLYTRNQKVRDLIDLGELTDEKGMATARILMSCIQPSYIGKPEILTVIILRLLNFTLKHGSSPYAPCAYAVYGAALCGQFGRIEQGYKFGEVALESLKKFHATELRCQVYFIFGNYISHWRKPLRESLTYLFEAYRTGSEMGGGQSYTSLSLVHYGLVSFWSGRNIKELILWFETHYEEIRQLRHVRSIETYELWYQFMLNLGGPADDKLIVKGKICDEKEVCNEWARVRNYTTLGYFAVYKQFLCYLYGALEDAVEQARRARSYYKTIRASILVLEQNFYESLSLLGRYRQVGKTKQKMYLRQVTTNQKRMRKWAAHSPENCANKYFLVEAEKSRIVNGVSGTTALYDKAISLAQKNEYLMEEALANELAAKFLLSREKNEKARRYMEDARLAYERWGANTKVRELEAEYSELLKGSQEAKTVRRPEQLDHVAVVSSLQAISTKMVLEDLLRTLMTIVIKDAGAERGFFISVRYDDLYIEAKAAVGQEEVVLFRSLPMEGRDFALSVANYVRQTMDVIVLDDAANEGDFTTDPYVVQNKPKSVLCLPVIRQSSLVGLLYLENNVATGVFTPGRIEVLKLLASQAAISFENARLYESVVQNQRALEKSEEKYRTILESIEDGYYEVDNAGNFRLVNDALCRIIGYSRNELLGMHYTQLMDANNAEETEETFRKVFTTEDPAKSFDNEFVRKDGERISNELSVSPIKDEQGEKIGFRGIVRDITERKRTAEELRMHRDHLEELVKERTVEIVKANEQLKREVRARGRAETELMRYQDQLEDLVEKRTVQLKSANEQLRQEIRDRKNAEEEAKLRQEQLFQAEKMVSLGTLVSGVAHEINNPISFITLNAPILQKAWDMVTPILDKYSRISDDFRIGDLSYEELRERIPRMLSGINEGGHRIKAIVKDLKAFSGKSPPGFTDMVDINEVTTRGVEFVSNLIKKPRNEFLEGYEPNVPPVKGNAQRIEQVVINLLVNACQSLSGEDEPLSISTAHDAQSNRVVIRIRDQGEGMSPEVLARIKDPFFTTKRDGRGTGLGLAISDRIITDHEGELVFESQLGQGTTATVSIPVAT